MTDSNTIREDIRRVAEAAFNRGLDAGRREADEHRKLAGRDNIIIALALGAFIGMGIGIFMADPVYDCPMVTNPSPVAGHE